VNFAQGLGVPWDAKILNGVKNCNTFLIHGLTQRAMKFGVMRGIGAHFGELSSTFPGSTNFRQRISPNFDEIFGSVRGLANRYLYSAEIWWTLVRGSRESRYHAAKTCVSPSLMHLFICNSIAVHYTAHYLVHELTDVSSHWTTWTEVRTRIGLLGWVSEYSLAAHQHVMG